MHSSNNKFFREVEVVLASQEGVTDIAVHSGLGWGVGKAVLAIHRTILSWVASVFTQPGKDFWGN